MVARVGPPPSCCPPQWGPPPNGGSGSTGSMGLPSTALIPSTWNGLPFIREREKGKGRREKKGRGRKRETEAWLSPSVQGALSWTNLPANNLPANPDSFSALKTTSGKSNHLAGVSKQSLLPPAQGSRTFHSKRQDVGSQVPGRQAPAQAPLSQPQAPSLSLV